MKARAIVMYLLLWVTSCGSAGEVTSYGGKLFLDGREVKLVGLRLANAIYSDEVTDRIIAELPSYRVHGVNAFSVYLQGGAPGFEIDPRTGKWYANSAFRRDGSLDPAYMARLSRLLDAADAQGFVVVVGFFYQRQCRKASLTQGLDEDHFESSDAICSGIRNATSFLLPWRNVIIDIANEFGHSGFQYTDVFPHYGKVDWSVFVAKAGALVDMARAVDPGRLVGVSPQSDIGVIPVGNVYFTHGHPQRRFDRGVPQLNIEQLNRKSKAAGVYSAEVKETIKQEMLQELAENNGWFWHSEWIQYTPFHVEISGAGTPENPGDGWWFEFAKEVSEGRVKRQVLGPGGAVAEWGWWPRFGLGPVLAFLNQETPGVWVTERTEAGWLRPELVPGSWTASTAVRSKPAAVKHGDTLAVVWHGAGDFVYFAERIAGKWTWPVTLAKGRDVNIEWAGGKYVVVYRYYESASLEGVASHVGPPWRQVILQSASDRGHAYPMTWSDGRRVLALWRFDDGSGTNYDLWWAEYVNGRWSTALRLENSDKKAPEYFDIAKDVAAFDDGGRVKVAHRQGTWWRQEGTALVWDRQYGAHLVRCDVDDGGRVVLLTAQTSRDSIPEASRAWLCHGTQIVEYSGPAGAGLGDVLWPYVAFVGRGIRLQVLGAEPPAPSDDSGGGGEADTPGDQPGEPVARPRPGKAKVKVKVKEVGQ